MNFDHHYSSLQCHMILQKTVVLLNILRFLQDYLINRKFKIPGFKIEVI